MPRYIDADAIEPSEIVIPLIDGGYEYVEAVYMDDLRDIPTADAVEVVRCRDCVWHGEKYCNNLNVWGFKDEDFCSLGRRKETEDE